jgi:3-oxoacyl-[acyl-carrier-protein] synthase-3
MSTAAPLGNPPARARPERSGRTGFAARVESVGAYLPERRLSTDELMARCRPTVHVDLQRLTGIRERRICSDGEDTVALAVGATRDCLAHSERGAADLDLVISCSISRFRGGLSTSYEPPLALAVKQAIGASRAATFDVTNACAGMMTGVLILEDFIRRGAVRRGLVVSGEYITSLGLNAAHDMRTIASRQMASLTVGDAGAAVVVERADDGVDRIEAAALATFARYDGLCVGRVGRCSRVPAGSTTPPSSTRSRSSPGSSTTPASSPTTSTSTFPTRRRDERSAPATVTSRRRSRRAGATGRSQ